MHTEAVSSDLALRIENTEVAAWVDMYQAIPADYARQFGFELFDLAGLVLTRCKAIPFVHFNCVKNLGLGQPATEAKLDEALRLYAQGGVTQFSIVLGPANQPPGLTQWLAARGLSAKGSWDRIFRAGTQVPAFRSGEPLDYAIEEVNAGTTARWTGFIDKTYGMPTGPWLAALVGRAGWHHYLLSRAGQDVCARSLFIANGHTAWLCIDAPVPGVMGPSFDDDARLCQVMVNDTLRKGVDLIAADIEAPSQDVNAPAYRNFSALGFQRAYLRQLFSH